MSKENFGYVRENKEEKSRKLLEEEMGEEGRERERNKNKNKNNKKRRRRKGRKEKKEGRKNAQDYN